MNPFLWGITVCFVTTDASLDSYSEDEESLNEEPEGEDGDSLNEESAGHEKASVNDEFDHNGSQRVPFFMLGMTFTNVEEVKRAVDQYAILEGVKLRILKSESFRIKYICQKGCPFQIYASKDGPNFGMKVKTLCYEHRCLRSLKNLGASAKWLARHFKNKIQERPQYKPSDMKKDVEDELKLHMSIYKCKRAKKMIVEEMEGSYKDEFRNLEAY